MSALALPPTPRKTALVLGGAMCVWEDADSAMCLFTPDAVAAVNNVGITWPGHLDHWFTLHPEKTDSWPGIVVALKQREAAGLNRPRTWSHRMEPGIDSTSRDHSGSSGLFAAMKMIDLGFKVVLAGVPMDSRARFHDSDKRRKWEAYSSYVSGWNKKRSVLLPHVRSMSGWTRQILGHPTKEWLAR